VCWVALGLWRGDSWHGPNLIQASLYIVTLAAWDNNAASNCGASSAAATTIIFDRVSLSPPPHSFTSRIPRHTKELFARSVLTTQLDPMRLEILEYRRVKYKSLAPRQRSVLQEKLQEYDSFTHIAK